MKDYIEERAVEIAYYIIEHKATVRQTAKEFGVSKSTIHKDCTDRLEQIFMNSKNLTIKLEKKQKESKGDDRKSGASKGSEGTAESDNKAPDSPKISKLLVGQSTNKLKA